VAPKEADPHLRFAARLAALAYVLLAGGLLGALGLATEDAGAAVAAVVVGAILFSAFMAVAHMIELLVEIRDIGREVDR
jgi:hypothetical protein